MDKLQSFVKEHSSDYGSVPFWSWNDDLDPEYLKKQINDMHDIGMKGFFMHARSGLETEYLSEKWFECIDASVKEAEKLGMQAWIYDENGWPSGFAGGKLLTCDENYAHYLKYEVLDHFDGTALGVYSIFDGKVRRLDGPDPAVKQYHTVYRCADDSYVDTMNPEITRKFIEFTHEEYKKRFGKYFGNVMPGFFTDEPQYYRWGTVWSDLFPAAFAERFGYDVMSALPALFTDFDGACEFRYDYYLLCHEMFTDNFTKVIYDWCEENGVKLTGHFVEETSLSGQMWCCGGIMPQYEYQQYPGVDHLGKISGNDIAPKQVGSVLAQLGKKRALAEIFACCGWEITPTELKRIGEHFYFGGVNLMCQHLYPYSERGQRKRDYPAHYSEHNSYYKEFRAFNDYFNKLGCALSYGKEYVNVLVVHPIHSAYLTYKRKEDYATVADLQQSIQRLNDCLLQNQITFHFGDEKIMARHARVEGDKLIVGNCAYDTVVLPLLYTIDSSTADLLREYLANGGKLINYADTLPDRIDGRKADLSWLRPNMKIGEICEGNHVTVRYEGAEALDIRLMERETDEGRMYFLFNDSRRPRSNVQVTVKGAKALSVFDLDTLEYHGLNGTESDKGLTVSLDFENASSFILLEKETKAEKAAEKKPITVTGLKLLDTTENALPLDYAEISYDGVNYGPRSPLMQIKDNLLYDRYKGRMWLRFRFTVDSMPETLLCVTEPMNYTSITLNGHPLGEVVGWRFDRSFEARDALPFVRSGENELILSYDYFQRDYVYHVLYGGVSESLRNCLNFDCEVEIPYLFGRFCVRTDAPFEPRYHDYCVYDESGTFVIESPHDPTVWDNLCAGGYTFFNGIMDIEVEHKNDGTELFLPGSYPTAQVFVNGNFAGRLMFKQHIALSGSLTGKDDRITVKVWATNRNLMGPHHCTEPEVYVTPPSFCFEKEWKGDQCAGYRHTYSFKRFGFDV